MAAVIIVCKIMDELKGLPFYTARVGFGPISDLNI
jgi:hypothetical protein